MHSCIRITIAIPILILSNPVLAQSIKDMDFLIGSWQSEETIYPGTEREYTETGTRTCSYYLLDAFIKCELKTTVTHTGRERHGVYLITWNDRDGYFSTVNLASDFPRPGVYQWYLDTEKK